MSASSTMLSPSDFGGYGRLPGENGGLIGKEFVASCPPDVQPNTRIIAVCGIPHNKDFSSPDEDGWFHSDFYLFFHLLQDVKDQIWLTSANPKDLVERYKEYVHGDVRGNRRVVLNHRMIPRIEKSGKLRVVSSNDLLERFVSTLRSEVNIAAKTKQPILVLVFGHGDDTPGIYIGGQGGTGKSVPRLCIRDIESSLSRGVDVSLMMTSCYSGGWVMKPNLSSLPFGLQPKPKLNITAMTATDQEHLSVSWAQSASCGRAAGSVFSTAVLHALLACEKETPEDPGMFTVLNLRDEETDDGDAIADIPTYVKLTDSIHKAMDSIYPGLQEDNRITFSAQDDKWDSEWRCRSGFPLLRYQELWDQLEIVPPGTTKQVGTGMEGGVGSSTGLTGGSISKAYQNIIRAKANAFMMSMPGDDRGGGNSDHRRFTKLLDGVQYDDDDLNHFNDVLDYRYNLMRRATEYAYILDLNFIDCLRFDVEYWILQNCADKSENAALARSRYNLLHSLIAKSKLFDSPTSSQGAYYIKPRQYLAIALAESCLDIEHIRRSIIMLLKLKSDTNMCLAGMKPAREVRETPEVVTNREIFYNTVGKLKRGLRSLSPRKRDRKPLQS